MMDSVTTVLSALASQWATVIAISLALITAAGYCYISWRTQSLHFLLRRFWLLVHGTKGIPDEDVRLFVDEQTSLHSFRLFSGVKVSTLENAKQLMAWCKRHNVPISQLSQCGDCFDPDSRKVVEKNIPRKPWRLAYALYGASAVIIGSISFGCIFLTSSLGQIKATERWIFMGEDSARAVFPMPLLNKRLDIGDCSNIVPSRLEKTSFTSAEVEILCGLLKHPEWKTHIKQSIWEQRWSFLWLALICGGVFYMVFSSVKKWWTARALLKRELPE